MPGQTEGLKEGRTERHYFIGPFRLPPVVLKTIKKVLNNRQSSFS